LIIDYLWIRPTAETVLFWLFWACQIFYKMSERVAIILAAGVSSRMKTTVPKVLHEVCGRPMLSYVLEACRGAGIAKIYVVVGFGSDQVKERFLSDNDIVWVVQEEQKGTAHAVLCCKDHLKDFDGEVLILCGDGPLIRTETLKTLIEKQHAEGSAATLATAAVDDPSGYGRIIRDEDGSIKCIVEHNDCDEDQLKIKEINPSYYIFDNKALFGALEEVRPDNAKKEYYLTDAVAIIIESGRKVSAVRAVRPEEAISVNTKEQLRRMNEIMLERAEGSKSNESGTKHVIA
jgi:bifunctional UDP-N-acetylglucosamine pyrophosphorylase/glucosamine-1-phosphate N-acetyltransferase